MIKEKVLELHKMIIEQKTIEALSIFYDDEIEMVEADGLSRKGLVFNIQNEKANVAKTKDVVSTLKEVAINEKKELFLANGYWSFQHYKTKGINWNRFLFNIGRMVKLCLSDSIIRILRSLFKLKNSSVSMVKLNYYFNAML